MKQIVTLMSFVHFISFAVLPAWASEGDDFSRRFSIVKPGDPLLVVHHGGSQTTGKFVAASAAGLQLRSNDRDVELARRDIAEVRRDGDSLWNGVLLGGVFGTAFALDYIGHVGCSTCANVPVGLVFGGGGAALGGLLDYLRRDTTLLYRAPSVRPKPVVAVRPTLVTKGFGVAVSVRF